MSSIAATTNAAHFASARYDRYVSEYESVRTELAEYAELARMDAISSAAAIAFAAIALASLVASLADLVSVPVMLPVAGPATIAAVAFARAWVSVAADFEAVSDGLRAGYGAVAMPELVRAYGRYVRANGR